MLTGLDEEHSKTIDPKTERGKSPLENIRQEDEMRVK
jgi:hypothetical protein